MAGIVRLCCPRHANSKRGYLGDYDSEELLAVIAFRPRYWCRECQGHVVFHIAHGELCSAHFVPKLRRTDALLNVCSVRDPECLDSIG